jgi:glyceraldehyde 3-phosphate dehydrogenase
MIRVAVNGFGRIGRVVTRILLAQKDVDVVAIHDTFDSKTLSHLFKYDSTHGIYDGDVACDKDHIIVNNKSIPFFQNKEIKDLPWKDLNVDYVLEATGKHKTRELAQVHLVSGAKRVIITAPAEDPSIKTIVLGVNHDLLAKEDKIVSSASCTTNNAAPMVDILHHYFEMESCYITTVHSYTGDQKLMDAPHKDLRRARSAAQSIVPTTTGAAKALTKIFPELSDSIGGCGIRVPVVDGSLTDITCVVKKKTTVKEVNEVFEKMAKTKYRSILDYSEVPLVSRDIIGNIYSCVFDADLTSVIGNMVKVVGWYDNEMGYSNRLLDMIRTMDKL